MEDKPYSLRKSTKNNSYLLKEHTEDKSYLLRKSNTNTCYFRGPGYVYAARVITYLLSSCRTLMTGQKVIHVSKRSKLHLSG